MKDGKAKRKQERDPKHKDWGKQTYGAENERDIWAERGLVPEAL